MTLDVRNLKVSLNHRTILENINFSHSHGITMILGPNGCGKSTLLRAIMGFIPIDSGEVRLNGCNIIKMPLRQRATMMAYLPQKQNTGLMLRVVEYVAMGESPQMGVFSAPNAAALRRAESLLEQMGLAELAPRSMDEISLGEMRLAGLARVQSQNADLMLLDEPLAGLDLKRRYDFLRRLKAMKCNVLMSLHEPDIAWQFAHRILVIDQRRLVCDMCTDTADPNTFLQALESVYGLPMHFETQGIRRRLIAGD